MHALKNLTINSLLFLVFSVCSSAGLNAAIRLPNLVGNNMVLQQNTDVKIWGWADAGEKVTVKASWSNLEIETTAGADQRWEIAIHTPVAGGPFSIAISGRDYTITLTNVMTGEVWLCSGQSNMEYSLGGLGGWNYYPESLRTDFAVRDLSPIRIFTVHRDTSSQQKEYCAGHWLVSDTAAANNISATAWFFGAALQQKLGVPVGLIVAAWGGTTAEAWTPVQKIESEQDLHYYLTNPNNSLWYPTAPGVLYNAMIHPLLNFAIKGAIWYQGESNRLDAKYYKLLMKALTGSWRDGWKMANFPFCFVQIAPFKYDEPNTAALLREAQQQCLNIPNTAMVVTGDLVDNINDIHPKNKYDVGNRLALCALAKTYSQQAVEYSGPVFEKMTIIGQKAVIEFTHAAGLTVQKADNSIQIAGVDHVFYPAKAKIAGSQLIVWSPAVKKPQAVRYAFSNTALSSIFNGAGLPASPFRTDTWDVNTHVPQLRVTRSGNGKIAYELYSAERESDIMFGFGKTVAKTGNIYRQPLEFNSGGTLIAVVARDGFRSELHRSWTIVANKARGCNVNYKFPYSEKYEGGGALALVDGLTATPVFTDNLWQGTEGSDVETVIDLGKMTQFHSIGCNFLSDNKSWIFLPKEVTVEISDDGIKYRSAGKWESSGVIKESTARIQHIEFKTAEKCRFVKLTATSRHTGPAGYESFAKPVWLFIDEIIVN